MKTLLFHKFKSLHMLKDNTLQYHNFKTGPLGEMAIQSFEYQISPMRRKILGPETLKLQFNSTEIDRGR